MLSFRADSVLDRLLRRLNIDSRLAAVASWIGAGAVAVIAMRYLPPRSLKGFLSGRDQDISCSDNKQTDRLDSEYEVLVVPGLNNTGSNCFLNVVLQALASCKVLVTFLSTCAGKNVANKLGQENDEQSDLPLATTLACLLEELCELSPSHRILSPRRVMLILDSYAKDFDVGLQQDAVEALTHLATALQDERVDFFERCRPALHSFSFFIRGYSSISFQYTEKHAVDKEVLDYWTHQLRWPLEGTFGSLLTCQFCDYQFSVHFQVFNEVPLLPQWDADGIIINGCCLEDCLARFIAPSRISDVICRHCSHLDAIKRLASGSRANMGTMKAIAHCVSDEQCSCEALILKHGGNWNVKRTAAYQCLRFGRIPEVLCLQIQRAVVMDSGKVQKLMGHVSFPMILDLAPYTMNMQHLIAGTEVKRARMHCGSILQMSSTSVCLAESRSSPLCAQELKSSKSETRKHIHLELLAVILHLGGPRDGHYMVYRKVKVPRGDTTPAFESSTNSTSWNKMDLRSDMMENDQSISVTSKSTSDVLMNDDIKELPKTLVQVEFQAKIASPFEASQNKENVLGDAMQCTRESCKPEESFWFLISDTIVKRVTEQEVLAADASLLLYGRIASTYSEKTA